VALARPERAVPRLLTQAVVLPAALSALVALVLVGEVRALTSVARWVQHTDQVIDVAHHLERVLIEVASEAGKGATFTLRLPATVAGQNFQRAS